MGILGESQAAYRADHSTADQLLHLSQSASEALQNKGCLASVFLDVDGAFDRVWHEGLLYKMQAHLFPPYLMKWTASYLKDREICVSVNGFSSSIFKPQAGVPQGSVVGPILYLIYMCQMPRVQSTLSQFADDTALWQYARKCRDACKRLQTDLDKITRWCTQWRVTLNPDKTQVLLFTRQRDTPPPLTLNGAPIPYTKDATFLGVKFTSSLCWKAHIDGLRAKAWPRVLQLKLLASKGLATETLHHIYKTCIRPVFTYAPAAWIAVPDTHMQVLEVIQNNALRFAQRVHREDRVRVDILRQRGDCTSVRELTSSLARRFFEKARHRPALVDEMSSARLPTTRGSPHQKHPSSCWTCPETTPPTTAPTTPT